MDDLLTTIASRIIDWQYRKDIKRLEDVKMTYRLMKRLIERGIATGNLDVENTMLKLDVFLMADRITAEEYQELTELIGGAE